MTQYELILNYLKKRGIITPMDAFHHLGITKLATRISEMRTMGYVFMDNWVVDYNRFGEKVRYKQYILVGEPK